MKASSRMAAISSSLDTPFGITPYWASLTHVWFWYLPTIMLAGTVPSARGLMYQPVVVAIMLTVPCAMFVIVAEVLAGYASMYLFSSARNAHVLVQPPAGSVGSESPSR